MSIYTENGYDNKEDYLERLSILFKDVPMEEIIAASNKFDEKDYFTDMEDYLDKLESKYYDLKMHNVRVNEVNNQNNTEEDLSELDKFNRKHGIESIDFSR